MNADVEIRPATEEDLVKFYGQVPRTSVMAWIALWRGRVVCVAGIAFEQFGNVAFSDVLPEVDAPTITIWRAAKQMFDAMRAKGFPLIVAANRHKDKSDKFLQSVGFEIVREDPEGNILYALKKC